jgi:membrane protease YdiL (CAAX protease family)
MTALAPSRSASIQRRNDGSLGWAVGLGVLALAAAPVGWAGLAVTVGAGILGIALPTGRRHEQPLDVPTWVGATVLGLTGFVAARELVVLPPLPLGASAVAVIVTAAVAEEAFFRRLAFGWLSRWGTLAAILLTSVAFAAVHVPAYGVAAIPVDLAAGLLFGWQRWATGSWIVPAVTHATANLLNAL